MVFQKFSILLNLYTEQMEVDTTSKYILDIVIMIYCMSSP